MLGWYTAATLLGLLVAFVACVGIERIKQEAMDAWDRRFIVVHPFSYAFRIVYEYSGS